MDSDSSDCIIISYMRCKFKLYHSFSQIIFHEPLLFVHESLLSVFSLCFTLQNVASLSFLQDKNVRFVSSLWKKRLRRQPNTLLDAPPHKASGWRCVIKANLLRCYRIRAWSSAQGIRIFCHAFQEKQPPK